MPKPEPHVPPLGLAQLTPLYDVAVALTMQESRLRSRLVDQLDLAPGLSVLEVGCGTGSLAIRVCRTEPRARVFGIDPDAQALRIAGRKASAAGTRIRFDLGEAERLRYPAESFDRVVFSLVLHHLDRAGKREALAEAWRVLRPGGSLHVADIGPAPGRLSRLAAMPIRVLDGERVVDNLDGLLPELVEAAGFRLSQASPAHRTLFGSVTFLRGAKIASH